MATQNVNATGTASLIATLRSLGIAIPEGTAISLTPSAPAVPDAPAPEEKKPGRKKRAASAPAPAVSPVVATTAKGTRVDLTEPYRAMVAFTHKAIKALRSADAKFKSKGIHSVYSGFNGAFGEHFHMAKEKVWETVDLMTERGDIQSHFAKGGKMLYLPGEMPEQVRRAPVADVLAKILG